MGAEKEKNVFSPTKASTKRRLGSGDNKEKKRVSIRRKGKGEGGRLRTSLITRKASKKRNCNIVSALLREK